MKNNKANNEADGKVFTETQLKPKLSFCNPREDGLGSALQLELHPATISHQGSMMLEFVEQLGNGYCDVDGFHNAKFDWGHSLKFRVGIISLAEIVSVIRGYQNNLGINGEGLEFKRKNDTVVLNIEWDTEDNEGRPLILKARVNEDVPWMYKMTRAEAIALQLIIEHSMQKLAWGEQV